MASAPTKPGSPGRSLSTGHPEYVLGAHDIDADRFERAKPAELQQQLLRIFRSPNYRPPVLPNVAIELTELTRKATASYDEVVSALQKDPLIVAGVLKVAQSPTYGGRLPVQSLKEAIQRLGINTLRDVRQPDGRFEQALTRLKLANKLPELRERANELAERLG